MIVLNVGCGPWEPVGTLGRGTVWPQATEIGIDLRPEAKPDVVADMRHLPFRDECFYGIIASHVLEHVPIWDVGVSLKEMHRVLRAQGTLDIRVPDLGWIAKKIVEEGLRPTFMPIIYGCGPLPPDGHATGFDTTMLVAAIHLAGFQETGVGTRMKTLGWWKDEEDRADGKEPICLGDLPEIKLRARKK